MFVSDVSDFYFVVKIDRIFFWRRGSRFLVSVSFVKNTSVAIQWLQDWPNSSKSHLLEIQEDWRLNPNPFVKRLICSLPTENITLYLYMWVHEVKRAFYHETATSKQVDNPLVLHGVTSSKWRKSRHFFCLPKSISLSTISRYLSCSTVTALLSPK